MIEQRQEFVTLAQQEDVVLTTVCVGLEISPKTGYSSLQRWRAEGKAGRRIGPADPASRPVPPQRRWSRIRHFN